jgi:hypothetical protein
MSFNKGEWKPTPKQARFLSVPVTVKEAAYGGGAGSAKTDVLLVYAIIHGWHKFPDFKQVFMRRTFPELRNEIIPRSQQIYPKFGATLNKSDMCWTFPREDQFGGRGSTNDGARIFLGQCEDEDDVHKYDSMEIILFSPDELTSFVEFIYLYIGFTRTRTSNPNLPAIIRTAGMPGGIGHTWVRKRFVDPSPPPNDGKIIIGRGGNKRIYIHATAADNPHLDPNYRQSLEALPEAEKRAKLHGDWNAYSGQVFDDFRDYKYPDEPDNALHVIEPFEIPDYWPKIVVGDWGFAANTWVGFGAISPRRRLYIYREMMWKRTKIELWAPYVKQYIEVENPKFIRFCKSAGQDRGQEHTIQQQISTALGRDVDLSNNKPGSRIAGKILLHEYLRWKQKPVVPQGEQLPFNEAYGEWLLRNKGLQEFKKYVKSYEIAPEEDNIPKLQIFNTCPAVIESIKAASYDKKRIEDIAEFDGDDPLDGVRYLIDLADNYFELAQDEFKEVTKRNEIEQRLATTGDFTAFYRNMRGLEAGENVDDDSPVVVKRYRSRWGSR